MRKNRLTTLRHRRISEFFWLATLAFIPMEMAAPLRFGPLSPYKISIGLWIIHFAFMFMDKPRPNRDVLRQSLGRLWSVMGPVLTPLLLYLAWDLFGLLWTEDIGFSLLKYATIIPMLIMVLGQAIVYFNVEVNLQRAFNRVMASLGLMAIVLCIWTWAVYFRDQRTAYILRLSLQKDYNQYATSILLGAICGMYAILRLPGQGIGKAAAIFAFNGLTLPILYLAGSRRTMILLLPVMAGYLVMLYLTRPKRARGRQRLNQIFTRFIPTLGLVLALVFSFGVIRLYEAHSEKVYKDMEMDHALQTGKYPFEFGKEMTVSAKQETLTDGSATSARSAIWSAALAEIKTYGPKDWLIGKGGSHHRDLYRKPDHFPLLYPDGHIPEVLRDTHPHSFVWVALLDHGLVGLGLTLAFIFLAIRWTFKTLDRKMTLTFTALVLYGGVVLANQVIDSIEGIQANRLTWILVLLLALAVSKEAVKEAGEYIPIRQERP